MRIKYVFFDKKTYIFTSMEVENKQQQTIDSFYEKFKNAGHEVQTALLAEITNQIAQLIIEENGKSDTTERDFDVLSDLVEFLQEDVEELIEAESDKKKFMKGLSKILDLLLNTNVSTIDKIKMILNIINTRFCNYYVFYRRLINFTYIHT